MENPIKNNLEFYSKFTKPLIFNLPEAKDRVLAAGWVKKIRSPDAGTEKLRTDYIKLLLFALQRQKLVGIFADDPESYETLEPFAEEYDLNEMAKFLIEKEQFERIDRIKRQLKGQGGDYPPYSTDCSSDFREYVAAQDIPNFGVHCYYAISKEPVNIWAKAEKGIFPKMAKSAVDTSGPSSPGTASDSCVCAPNEDPQQEPSECKKRVPSITESPKRRRSPKKLGKSPPTQPIGKMVIPDEREPPLWGSNLLEVRDATPQDDDSILETKAGETKSKQQPIDEDDDFDLKEMEQAMKDFKKGILSPHRGKGQSRRPMHKPSRQDEAEQSHAPPPQDESAVIGEQDLEISMYDEDIQEDKRLIDYFREKLEQSNIKQNITEVSEQVKESSPATAGIPLTTPIPSPSPRRPRNSEKLYMSEKERCQPKRKMSPERDADLMKLFQDAIGAAESLENTSLPSGIQSSSGSSPGQQYDQLFSTMDQANIQETSMPSGIGSMITSSDYLDSATRQQQDQLYASMNRSNIHETSMSSGLGSTISSGQGSPSRQRNQLSPKLDKSNIQHTSVLSGMASKHESSQKQQKPQSPVKPIEKGSPESAPIYSEFVQCMEENAAKGQENQPAPNTPPIFSKDPATRAAAQDKVYVDGMEHDGPWMHGPEFFEGMEEFEPYDPRLREVPEEMFPGLQQCLGDQFSFNIEGEPNHFDETEQYEQLDISGRELQQIADQSMDMLTDEDPYLYGVCNESLPVSPMTILDTRPPSGLSMAMPMSPTPPQRQSVLPQMSPHTPQANVLPQREQLPEQEPPPQRTTSPQQRISSSPPSPRAAAPCGSPRQQTSSSFRQSPVFETTSQPPCGADFRQLSGKGFNYLTADQIGQPVDLFSEIPPENYFAVDEVVATFDSFGNSRSPSPAGAFGSCSNVGGYKSDDCMGILDISGLDSIGTSMYSMDELPDLSYQELQKFPPPPVTAAGSCRTPREFEHVGYAGDYKKPARLDIDKMIDESLRKAQPNVAPKKEKPQLSPMEKKYIDWVFAGDKDTRDMVKRVASMVADVEQDFPDPYHIMPPSPQLPPTEGYGLQDESFPENLISPQESPLGAAALPPGAVPPKGATPPPPGPPSPVMRPLCPLMKPSQPQPGSCGSGIKPPASGLRQPGSRIRQPGTGLIPPRSGIQPPKSSLPSPGVSTCESGIRPPGSSLRSPGCAIPSQAVGSGIRPPVSKLRPPGSVSALSGIRPPGSGIPVPGTGIRSYGSGIPPSSSIRTPGGGIRSPGTGIQTPGSIIPTSGSNIQPPDGKIQPPRSRACGATPTPSRTDVALEMQKRITGPSQRQRQLLEESMIQGVSLENQFNIQLRPAFSAQRTPKSPSSVQQSSRSPLSGVSMMDGSGFMNESPPAGIVAESPRGTPCGVCGGTERVSPTHQLLPSSRRDGLISESPPPDFFDIHSSGGAQRPYGVCSGSGGIMRESPPAGLLNEPYHVDVRTTDKSGLMRRTIDRQQQILDATSQAEQISNQMESKFVKRKPGMLSAGQQRDLAEPRYAATPQAGGPCQAGQRKRGVSRRGPETRRRILADEYGIGPELQDRQDEYISGVLARHPDLPQLPQNTPQGSPCLLDQSVPQNLPTPLRPPVVVPGWQTPEHLKKPDLSPRQFENIGQNDMNTYFFNLHPDVELIPTSPRLPSHCGTRQQQRPLSPQACLLNPAQYRSTFSQPQQHQPRSRSPYRTGGGSSPRSTSPPQRTPPPGGSSIGPAPRPPSTQTPRTPNVFDMFGKGSGLMEESPPKFQDVQSPDVKDSCACIEEATQLPSPPPLQVSPGAAGIMSESPPPGFGPLPFTADDMLKKFTIVRDGKIVQKSSRPEGPQRQPPIRQPSPLPAQTTPITQSSPPPPSPHQAYAGTPQKGTPCQAGSKRRGMRRRGTDARKRRLEVEYGDGHEIQHRNEQYMTEVFERHPNLPPASPCTPQQRPSRQFTTWETPENLRLHQPLEALTKGQPDAMFFNQLPDIQLAPSSPPLTSGQVAQRSPCQQMNQRSPSPQQRTPQLPSPAGPIQWENPDQWFLDSTPEMYFPSSPPASPCGGYQQQPIPMHAVLPSPQQETPRQPCSPGRSVSPITTPQLNLTGPLGTPPSGTAYRRPMRWNTKKHEPMMGPIKESSPGLDQFGLPRVQEFPVPISDPTPQPPPAPTGIPGWSTPPHLKDMRGIPDAHFFDNEYQSDLLCGTPRSPVTPHASPSQCGIYSESPPEALYSPASVGTREQSFYTPQMDVQSGQMTRQWEEMANTRFDDSFGDIDLVSSPNSSSQRTSPVYLDQSSRGLGTPRSLSPGGQMLDMIDQPYLNSPCDTCTSGQGSPRTGSPLTRRNPPGRPTRSPPPSSDVSYYSKAQLSSPAGAQRSPAICSPNRQANIPQQQQQHIQQQQQQNRQLQQQEQQQESVERTVSRTYVQRKIVTGLPTPPKELYGSGLSSGEKGMLDVSDDTIPPELANFKWMDQ